MGRSGLRWRATGDVLINGLELGIAAQIGFAKAQVSSVTVIKDSEDVIGVVVPHLADHRLTGIHADALQSPKSEVAGSPAVARTPETLVSAGRVN
jgi:hypothetical protein